MFDKIKILIKNKNKHFMTTVIGTQSIKRNTPFKYEYHYFIQGYWGTSNVDYWVRLAISSDNNLVISKDNNLRSTWLYTKKNNLVNIGEPILFIGNNFSVVTDPTQAVLIDIFNLEENGISTGKYIIMERSTDNYITLPETWLDQKYAMLDYPPSTVTAPVAIFPRTSFPARTGIFNVDYMDKIPPNVSDGQLPSGFYTIGHNGKCLKGDGLWTTCSDTSMMNIWKYDRDNQTLTSQRQPSKKSIVALTQMDTSPDYTGIPPGHKAIIAPIFCDDLDNLDCMNSIENDPTRYKRIILTPTNILDSTTNLCYDENLTPYWCNGVGPFSVTSLADKIRPEFSNIYQGTGEIPPITSIDQISNGMCHVNAQAGTPQSTYPMTNFEPCCRGDYYTARYVNPAQIARQRNPDPMADMFQDDCQNLKVSDLNEMVKRGKLDCFLDRSNWRPSDYVGCRRGYGDGYVPWTNNNPDVNLPIVNPSYVLTSPVQGCDGQLTQNITPYSDLYLDQTQCPSNWCPFSTACSNSKAMRNYCSGIDSNGHPLLNTDLNCDHWCQTNGANCGEAADAFCKKYPDHPACACITYNESKDWQDIKDMFKISLNQSYVPDPACWAPQCTQRSANDPDRSLFNNIIRDARGSGATETNPDGTVITNQNGGCKTTLAFCKQEIDVSNVGGDVTIMNNTFSQICKAENGAQLCDYNIVTESPCVNGSKTITKTLKPGINNPVCTPSKSETVPCEGGGSNSPASSPTPSPTPASSPSSSPSPTPSSPSSSSECIYNSGTVSNCSMFFQKMKEQSLVSGRSTCAAKKFTSELCFDWSNDGTKGIVIGGGLVIVFLIFYFLYLIFK